MLLPPPQGINPNDGANYSGLHPKSMAHFTLDGRFYCGGNVGGVSHAHRCHPGFVLLGTRTIAGILGYVIFEVLFS